MSNPCTKRRRRSPLCLLIATLCSPGGHRYRLVLALHPRTLVISNSNNLLCFRPLPTALLSAVQTWPLSAQRQGTQPICFFSHRSHWPITFVHSETCCDCSP